MRVGRIVVVGLSSLVAVVAVVAAAALLGDEPDATAVVDSPVAGSDAPALLAPASTGGRQVALRAAHLGWYGASVGTRLTYGCRLTLTTSLRRGEERASDDRYELTGACLVSIVRRDGERIITRLSMPQASLSASGGGGDQRAIAEIADDLAAGVLVDQRPDGQVVGVAFPDGAAQTSHNWLRTLVDAMQFRTNADAGTWQLDEVGANGPANVIYTWESPAAGERPQVLEKRRERERKVTVAEVGAPAKAGPDGASWHGRARAKFAPDIGWLATVSLNERCTGGVADVGMAFEMAMVVELELQATEAGVVSDLTLPTAWESLDGSATSAVLADRRATDEVLRDLKGRSVAQLLADFATAGVAQDSEGQQVAFHLLLRALRALPELQNQLIEWLQRGTADAALLETAAVALASVGSSAAQAALARWLGDAGTLPALRQAALRAVFAIEHPLPEIAARAAEIAEAGVDGDSRMAGLLALGCAAGRVAAEHTELFAAQLHALRAGAEQRGDLRGWFEAVGNSGLPDAIDWIVPFADAAEDVQADRLIALRRVQDPRALQVLTAAAASPLARVRERALEALAERPQQARAVLLRAVEQETDADVLRQALRGVADLIDDPAMRAALARRQRDAQDDLRETIDALLARR